MTSPSDGDTLYRGSKRAHHRIADLIGLPRNAFDTDTKPPNIVSDTAELVRLFASVTDTARRRELLHFVRTFAAQAP